MIVVAEIYPEILFFGRGSAKVVSIGDVSLERDTLSESRKFCSLIGIYLGEQKSNAAVKQLRTKEVNYKGKGVFAELIIGTSIIATHRLRDV